MPNASTAVCTMRPAPSKSRDRVVVRHRLAAERLDLLAHLRRRVFFGASPRDDDADVVDDDRRAFSRQAQANSRPIPRPEPVTIATRPSSNIDVPPFCDMVPAARRKVP